MIHEYALEPSVLLNWASNKRDFAEFIREYGLGTPRIISSFPKQQVSKLRSYFLQKSPADNQSLHCQRYTELVTKLVETIVLREFPENPSPNWQDVAVIENQRMPFGVVMSENPINTGGNITISNMYDEGAIWHHLRQENITRTVDGISSVLTNLIRLSTKKVVVIDTFGWTPEAIAVMQNLINTSFENRVSNQKPNFMLYFKEKRGGVHTGTGSPGASFVKREILSGVTYSINLEVYELNEVTGSDVFHNRCVLTEHGGVSTGHGIGVSGIIEHTDEATLMEVHIYQKKWRQFVENLSYRIASSA